MTLNKELPLTLVLVKEENEERYSSYFEEMPNIHASGATEKEATENLVETVGIVFTHKRLEAEAQLKEQELLRQRMVAERKPFTMAIAG